MSARWLKNHFAIFAIQLLLKKKRERTYYWSWSLLNSYPLPNLNFVTLKKLIFKVLNCSFNTKVQNLLNPTTTVHFEILVPISVDLLWGAFPSFSRLWAQSNWDCACRPHWGVWQAVKARALSYCHSRGSLLIPPGCPPGLPANHAS